MKATDTTERTSPRDQTRIRIRRGRHSLRILRRLCPRLSAACPLLRADMLHRLSTPCRRGTDHTRGGPVKSPRPPSP